VYLSQRIGILALLTNLFLMASAGPGAARVFDPETFTLDNGMQVVVITNRNAPVVTHMVWYKVGAADEPPGRSGVAHFLEHLMFLGTGDVPEGEFSNIVARSGGQENAFTAWDYTAYFQSIAVDRLPLVMELEADRMTNLAVSAERALVERNVIIEERRQRVDDDPSARLNEQMFAALFLNNPYGRPIIGWEHEIAGLTLDDALAFYRDWYAPNNATLVVSGDIDAETLRPLAERTYGRIPARAVPDRNRLVEPAHAVERRVVLRDESVVLPSWRRFYLAPSFGEPGANPGDVYALQVLNEILGAGSTSRLYKALVVDQGLAVGAGSSFSPSDLNQTAFAIFITPRADADLVAVEAAVDAEIARLLDGDLPEEELAAARERLAIEAIYARDSLFGPARTVGQALTIGRALEDVESWPERIRAVGVADVLAAARTVFDPTRAVTGMLVPTGEAAGQMAGRPETGAPAAGVEEEIR
jgi:zinc protease